MPRGRGRPKGTTGPRTSRSKAVAQVLKPRHEQIVLLHLAGYDNVEIAQHLGIDKQTVSNTLGDPRALALIEAGKARIRQRLGAGIEERLHRLAKRSVKNLAVTVNAEIAATHPAKKHQDDVGIKLLQHIGFLQESTNKPEAPALSEGAANRLSEALEKATKGAQIVVETGQIQEAEYVVTEK